MFVHKTYKLSGILHSGVRPLLRHLDMELTERCNNRCIHCYNRTDDPNAQKRELSTSAVTQVLDEAAALGCISVRFTGGEPLLREDFPRIYHHARSLGLQGDITTNGTLITPDLARIFAEIPPMGNIEVSLYGSNRESCEALTRTGNSFDLACAGVRNLIDHKVPFKVRSVVLPGNRLERPDFEAWAASLNPLDPVPMFTVLLDLRARRDSPKKNRRIRELRFTPDECFAQLAFHPETYFRDVERLLGQNREGPDDRLFTCGAGKGSACLDAYGRLQACFLLRHPDTIYALQKPGHSLEDAMKKFFPELRRMRAQDARYLSRCARCFLRGLCDQCPARSWTESGALDTPIDYHCRVAHFQAYSLALLAEGEKAWQAELDSDLKPVLDF